ncbi:MAG: 1-acyl-sn-glycerol-3-phosphate acyltransferase [Thermoflexibacter sp.]|nr:1-acyl-sn-glycerol-3-phosphate acyltransferase [Thermoflexibacter sp.]
MRKILSSIWFYFTLLICFIFLIPLPLILVHREKWHIRIYQLTKFWVGILLKINFLPLKIEYRFRLQSKQVYIFAPNHTSYLDIILLMYAIKKFFIFVGKSSISKAPLAGYVYKKMHITVDRSKARSKYSVLEKSKIAIKKRKSVVIFPEGGILTHTPPQMTPFKEGAFRLAIEEQIPIVPVTMPYNWLAMPDKEYPPFIHHKLKVVFHEPIDTKGLTIDDLPLLKQKVFEIISNEIQKHHQPSIKAN